MALLDIINLKTYFPSADGLVKAVDAVDLRIENGERLGLIGETGCGKTVLGMSIIRLLSSSTRIQGQIIYKGRDLLGLTEDEMRLLRGGEIAMILQNPTTSLNPVLKVGDQIAEVIRLHGGLDKKAAKAKAVEMLAATMIPNPLMRADQYPHELSGGMKERVMIAMGLAGQPSFVIADEPTRGLDARTKAEIVKLIRDMTAGRSMLMITHDLKAAGEACDRIAVMYAGELLEIASAELILSDPCHPYTQGFVHSLPSRGLQPIPGSSPSLIDPPSGCRFHPRCPRSMDICQREHPPMIRLHKGDFVRCFLCT
ncbi:MAG: Trehalose/maltose import ATP-binding protein MalK [Methanosaeta sp. PtaU1.Bin112]|nr:MAG: Trehalose/maltose import ATP-binding protein MalK [Methanosaeta sp. PtaU1.Bin112]